MRSFRQIGSKKRGFTLLEVLVAFSIFAALGLIVALSIRAYASNQVKGNLGSDIDRALSVTAGRLETVLRGCRVVSPSVGATSSTLQYQAPEVNDNGLLVVTSSGQPVWQAVREITLAEGQCTISGDNPIVVGRLGDLGEILFERREARVLRASLTAGWSGAESIQRKSATLNILLPITP